MPTYIDTLPIDILRQTLFPFLNYNEKTALNLYLAANDRIVTRLDKNKIIQFEMVFSTIALKKGLGNINNLYGDAKAETVYTYFNETVPDNLVLVQYKSKYREALNERIAHFSDTNNRDYGESTEDFKSKMVAACTKLKKLLATNYTYICEIMLPVTDCWSPVENDSYRIVVKHEYADRIKVHIGDSCEYIALPSKNQYIKKRIYKYRTRYSGTKYDRD